MNSFTVLGRLTKDPDLRYSNGEQQTAIVKFSIADNKDRPREGEKAANFWNCVAFGKQAEAIEKWLKKGQEVLVTGTLDQGSYNDKNGNQKSTLDLRVEKWRMTGSRASSSEATSASSVDVPASEVAEGFIACEENPWM